MAERKLAPNTQALLRELKKIDVREHLNRARKNLADGDLDAAAATVAAISDANRGVYDARRIDSFKTAKNYFKYGRAVEEALKRVVMSNIVWEYLEQFLGTDEQSNER